MRWSGWARAVRSVAAGATVRPTGDGTWLEAQDVDPSPDLIAAVAEACREAGLLIVESRAGGGSWRRSTSTWSPDRSGR